MKMVFKRFLALALCTALILTLMPSPPASAKFSDVGSSYWANTYITYLESAGILRGNVDDTFRPDSEVSCAEFTALVCRATGMFEAKLDKGTYWAEAPLAYARYKGWYTNTEIPSEVWDKPITRELACKMIVLAMFPDYDLASADPGKDTMTDLMDADAGYISYIRAASAVKVITGYEDGSFRPKDGITRAEAATIIARAMTIIGAAKPVKGASVRIPILMYHHLSDEPGASTTSPAKFKADMNELSLAGYTPVFLDDLYDFVTGDAALPAKPVVITFDDGYQSNYEYAFPVLKQHKFKAEISVIGWSIGKSQYDEGIYAGMKIIKHFSLAEAKTMVDSKLVHIESHSYAMHEYSPNGNVSRLGVLKKPGESYEDYIKAFTDDSAKMTKIISDALGYRPKVFTYPYGLYSALTEKLLESLGYSITIITESGISTVTKGDMQSLHCLKRLSMDNKTGCVTAAIENNLTKS